MYIFSFTCVSGVNRAYIQKSINVIKFPENNQPHDLYFVPALLNSEVTRKIVEISNANPEAIFIFAQKKLTTRVVLLLRKLEVQNKNFKYLVVQQEPVFSNAEFLKWKLYQKFGICRNNAQKISLREKDRMFNGINIRSFNNLSDDLFISTISKFLICNNLEKDSAE